MVRLPCEVSRRRGVVCDGILDTDILITDATVDNLEDRNDRLRGREDIDEIDRWFERLFY